MCDAGDLGVASHPSGWAARREMASAIQNIHFPEAKHCTSLRSLNMKVPIILELLGAPGKPVLDYTTVVQGFLVLLYFALVPRMLLHDLFEGILFGVPRVGNTLDGRRCEITTEQCEGHWPEMPKQHEATSQKTSQKGQTSYTHRSEKHTMNTNFKQHLRN